MIMKKISKKIFFIVMLIIISTLTATALQTTDAEVVKKSTLGGIEYSYKGEISPEKAEQVVKAMFGIIDDAVIQPFSILCIFGHSKEQAGIRTTEHYYYTTFPRCRETYTDVEYCTRASCNYFIITDEYSTRAVCH